MRVSLILFLGIVALSLVADPGVSGAAELSWQDCLREAAKNHPDLIAAGEGVVQRRAAQAIAVSGVLPQVTAGAGLSASDSTASGSSQSVSGTISGSLVIFDGLKTPNMIRSAREGVAAAKEDYRFASADVRYRLRQAFVNLSHANAALALSGDIRKLRQGDVDLISLRYSSGTEHRGALLSAKADLSQAVEDIGSSRRALVAARQQLVKEMGREAFSDMQVSGDLLLDMNEQIAVDLDVIAARHPSVLKAVAMERGALADLNASAGGRWPQVSLTGDVSRSDTRWVPQERGSTAGVRVSLPLFEGGAIAADIDRARSVYRQRQQEARSVKDGVRLTLEQAWNKLKDAAANVTVQEEFLAAAEERARIAEQQYAIGLVTFDNWTIIEDSLVSARKSLLEARTNALLAEAGWIQAKGGTLEYGN